MAEILAEYGSKAEGPQPRKIARKAKKRWWTFPTGKLPPIPPARPGDGADEPTIGW